MQRRKVWSLLVFLACAAAGGGCGNGAKIGAPIDSSSDSPTVSAGATVVELNLSKCQGKRIECSNALAEPKPLVVNEVQDCEPERQSVSFAWTVSLAERDTVTIADANSDPYLQGEGFAVALDGSFWVASRSKADGFMARRVRIEHYDAMGELIGSREVDLGVLEDFYAVDRAVVAVDSDGRAYVGYAIRVAIAKLSGRKEERFWIGRYASDASPIGELIPVIGASGADNWLRIAAGADDALLVAVPGDHQSVALGRIDADGGLQWTRSGGRQSVVYTLLGDADGVTALGGANPGASAADSFRPDLVVYDAHGNLLWDRETAGVNPFAVAADPAGGWLALDTLTESSAIVGATIHRIDADGELRSSVRMHGPGQTYAPWPSVIQLGTSPVTDGEGNTYFAAAESNAIYELDADDERCAILETERSGEYHALGVSPDGTLVASWFDAADGWMIARLER